MGFTKYDCVYYDYDSGICRLPGRSSCRGCRRYRKPIHGLTLAEHVQLDEAKRGRQLTLTLAVISFVFSITAIILSTI